MVEKSVWMVVMKTDLVGREWVSTWGSEVGRMRNQSLVNMEVKWVSRDGWTCPRSYTWSI